MDGILIINKPECMTSRDVVNQVSKILHIKKVGHTGTLDPMATGVLVLCIGKATKLVELLTSTEKEYIAEITLGIKTDTLDKTGTVLQKESVSVSKEQVEMVLSSMIGTYEQEVPIYSAVHVNGKKLYEYARKKEEVILPKRSVSIMKLDLLDMKSDHQFTIYTKVSKGTYIRSLVKDIATNLNTIGVMSTLKRIKQGNFTLKEAVSLTQIKEGNFQLRTIQEVLQDYPMVMVDQILENKIRHGQLLLNTYDKDCIVFLSKTNEVLALYQIYEKDRRYLKPWKMF